MKVNIGGRGRMGVAAVAAASLARLQPVRRGQPAGAAFRRSSGTTYAASRCLDPGDCYDRPGIRPRAFPPSDQGSLVADTARPRENFTVLQAGPPPRTVIASASPAPPTVVIPGRPAALSGDETDYQSALYAKRLKHWRDEAAAGGEPTPSKPAARCQVG
jgi:hypothetical protein